MRKFLSLSITAAILICFLSVTESSAQTRVSFAPGKSSTVISGILGKRGANDAIKKFVVRAKSGQHLSVVVKAADNSVYTNMNGEETERGADFYYTLDASGDHEFIVENVGTRSTKFTMTVSIRR